MSPAIVNILTNAWSCAYPVFRWLGGNMIHRRHIVIGGQSVTLYSKDSQNWFMRPIDSMNHHRRRARERESIRQSFLMSYSELEDIDPVPVEETRSWLRPRR